MVVLSPADERDQDDSESIRALRFDVVRRHAAKKLRMRPADVKNHHLADLFGLSLKSISRFRNRRAEPSLDTAMHIGEVLDLPVEDLIVRAQRVSAR